jgi:protein-disulfide isomerase
MDLDETESKQAESKQIESKNESNDGKITIKKSTFNALLASIIAVSLVAAFFAGSYINLKSDELTKSQLDDAITKSEFNDIIAKLEAKISKEQQVEQPSIKLIDASVDDDPVKGEQNAPITIIEFSDFQCPFCARFHEQTLPLILEQYVETGKVKFVYRDFPIQTSHPNAMPAAAASECAHEQDKYWEYHDELFKNQGIWNNMEITSAITIFKEYATKLELNQEQFDSCLDSGKYIEEINKDLRDGQNYGITGTPGFFIGNEQDGFIQLTGARPFEAFKSVIDSQLNS